MHITEALNERIETEGVKYFVFTTVAGKRRLGRVTKFNKKSCWVKIMKGARTFFIIKRKKATCKVHWERMSGI